MNIAVSDWRVILSHKIWIQRSGDRALTEEQLPSSVEMDELDYPPFDAMCGRAKMY
ncbi:hypothetical protein V7O66_04590 [Methanolobus sp. ZRKC3]|uniref:hypothetical protein n=1 Tax=Methanolobus sp. ZRKC3 TaxID=3125786 RepID=UPI00324D8EBC